MAISKKTAIIERIFDQLYDPVSEAFSRTVVTAEDVQAAKRYCRDELGMDIRVDANPFNFMKDIVRGNSAERIWPQRLRELGVGGQQRTGGGAIFEFIHGGVGVLHSLSEDYKPTEQTPLYPVQSLSLPLASKALGRTDESWLLQVAVNLRIVESHFAIGEEKQIDPLEVYHLQMDIKLRRVQIDALYRVLYLGADGAQKNALITVEAKQGNQRILTEQIKRQVIAAFEATDTDLVVPLAIAAVRGEGIFVVEFEAVNRSELEEFDAPIFYRDAMFTLQPPVSGI